tara:strand:- start:7201 stop:7848 length:648 start_codon:yes stop_codon:yes gene_type:complete
MTEADKSFEEHFAEMEEYYSDKKVVKKKEKDRKGAQRDLDAITKDAEDKIKESGDDASQHAYNMVLEHAKKFLKDYEGVKGLDGKSEDEILNMFSKHVRGATRGEIRDSFELIQHIASHPDAFDQFDAWNSYQTNIGATVTDKMTEKEPVLKLAHYHEAAKDFAVGKYGEEGIKLKTTLDRGRYFRHIEAVAKGEHKAKAHKTRADFRDDYAKTA